MKKLVFAFVLSSLFIACKQKDQNQQQINSFSSAAIPQADICSIFDTLQTMTTKNQVGWLQLNENIICEPIYDSCRVAAHAISRDLFNRAIANFWGSQPIITSEYDLAEIKSVSEQTKYEEFIIGHIDEANKITLKSMSDFTQQPSCYSVPLFYSIARVKKLSDSATFMFTRAKINNLNTIVFSVNGNDFYDSSSFPL